MCKTVFIATKEPVTEIPFNEKKPDFSVIKIGDEYAGIKSKFSNPYIYLVHSSRGCGCDFGISEIPDLERYLELEKRGRYPVEKIASAFRTLFGREKDWQKKHKARAEKNFEESKFYVEQTKKLKTLIISNVTPTSDVEVYSCWSGDYDSPIEETIHLDITAAGMLSSSQLDLNEKLIFSASPVST